MLAQRSNNGNDVYLSDGNGLLLPPTYITALQVSQTSLPIIRVNADRVRQYFSSFLYLPAPPVVRHPCPAVRGGALVPIYDSPRF